MWYILRFSIKFSFSTYTGINNMQHSWKLREQIDPITILKMRILMFRKIKIYENGKINEVKFIL